MLGIRPLRRNGTGRFSFAPSPHLSADTPAIGGNAVLSFVEAAESLGYRREAILDGLHFDLAALRKRRARVSWRELVHMIENGERAGMTLADLELAGEHIAGSPHLLLKPIVNFFLRPEHLMYVGLRWIGPGTFPVFEEELEHEARDFRLSLALPAQLPGCAAYFHICTGTLAATTTGIGQPKARVAATISPRRGVFEIQCAPFDRGAVRIGRIARALFSVPRVIETLAGQDQAIRQGLDAAHDAESRFLGVLGTLPDGVAIVRRDEILFANVALARTLGFERASELVGTPWSQFDAGGQSECRVVSRGGGEVVLELSPRQAIDYRGEPAELVLARDVTEKKELGKRLAVADRMASLATVAAGLAHEINNPLALVISNLELCARRPDDAREFLRAASEGAERVKNIVRELRVFSQPELEAPVPVDLRDVVESSVALARGKAKTRASLSVAVEPVGPVAGSRGKLSQVLLNLIINALEALPGERPSSENQIVVRLMEQDGQARIEVEDNGVGIAEEARPHLFEPFFTTRRAGGGSGLGLAVAHDIISRSGGTITFTSRLGIGTRFVIELPLCQEPTAVAAPTADREERQLSLRILIADDEPSLVRTLEAALSQDRHHVVSAATGREAIDRIERDGDFDLILCDLIMPHGSGADVYAFVRARRPELAARIVFMTGGTFRGGARDFLATVENPCLDKPFRLEELGRLIVSARDGGWAGRVRV
jgi:signal transduction histidine kinase/CheY-like chemotaxis protein